MQNVVQLFPSNDSLLIPGLVAYGHAQQGRDTFKCAKNKEEALPWLDEVMDMKRDVESFNETLDPKIQADNHYYYVQALIIVFPIYYRIGDTYKARRAYERAKAWALDEALLGISTDSYLRVELGWSELSMPWHRKAWKRIVDMFNLIGKQQILKWKSGS